MSKTTHLPSLVATLGCWMVVVVLNVNTTAAQEASQIDAKIDALQKTVADELSGKQEFVQAEAELLELLKQITKSKEPAAGSREAKVFDRIGELLIKVRARLPEPYAGGSGEQTAMPVPQFDERKVIGKIVQQLRKSQIDLLTQARSDPESKATRDLLIAVALGQEDLAWEVGWPFTEEEVKAYQAAGGLTKEIYLSRRTRGVEQINEALKADFDLVGRETAREFVILRPVNEEDASQIEEKLKKVRGEPSAAWREGTKPFDEAFLKSLFQR